jgi:hypothetical protein
MTGPTLETLTDHEKLALTEILDFYIDHLHTYNCTEASVTFYGDLAEKLDRILYPEDYD